MKMPLEYFTEWKVKLLEIIHKERKVLKGKIKCRPVQKYSKTQNAAET